MLMALYRTVVYCAGHYRVELAVCAFCWRTHCPAHQARRTLFGTGSIKIEERFQSGASKQWIHKQNHSVLAVTHWDPVTESHCGSTNWVLPSTGQKHAHELCSK